MTHVNELLSSGNPDHIDVTLGAYNLYDVSSLLTLHTTQFIVHEGWDPDRHQNDVALIKLPFNVTFTEFVQPVELDRGGHDNRRRMATVISWGETQIRSSGLTRIDQIILSNKRCASASDFYEKVRHDEAAPVPEVFQFPRPVNAKKQTDSIMRKFSLVFFLYLLFIFLN